jgi:hypothetical protein
VSHRAVLYLIAALVLVHNAEEALAFTRLWTSVREHVKEVAGIGLSTTPEPMYPALLVATLVPAAIMVWAARRPDRPVRLWFALLVQTVIFLNALAHVAIAFVGFHGYAPGLLSAVLLNVPYSVFVYRKARQGQWISVSGWWLLLPAALLVHGPLLVGLLFGVGAVRGA